VGTSKGLGRVRSEKKEATNDLIYRGKKQRSDEHVCDQIRPRRLTIALLLLSASLCSGSFLLF
jgi:hypothetical protein